MLYEYMKHVIDSLPRQDHKFCTEVLSVMAIVYDVLHVDELRTLVNMEPRVDLTVILGKCSSFLEVRDSKVSFSH
ncbi:hypothetical protein F4810DRAFT_684056 [Camillea tinctor]|nr:hypothetical protein F4810DRAFT_684056 [Camillea tinctor]